MRPGRKPIRDGWWYRADDAQRLFQLDAGIELGLTIKQIALALSGHWKTISAFAYANGRQFPTTYVEAGIRRGRMTAGKRSAGAAYFRGENVDMWRDGAQDRTPHDNTFEEIVLE